MSDINIFKSIIEVVLAAFFIWGLFNEPKLARLEKRLFAKFSKKSKIIHHDFKNAA